MKIRIKQTQFKNKMKTFSLQERRFFIWSDMPWGRYRKLMGLNSSYRHAGATNSYNLCDIEHMFDNIIKYQDRKERNEEPFGIDNEIIIKQFP